MLSARHVPWEALTHGVLTDWRALAERVAAPPDLSHEWAESLITAHEIPPNEVHVIELRHGDSLRAIVPIRVSRGWRFALPRVTIELLCSTFPLHLDILRDISAVECLTSLFDTLDREFGRWSVCIFNGTVRDGELARGMEVVAERRRLVLDRQVGDASPYLDIDGSFDAFIAGKSANFRSNLKRKTRRFREAGQTQIRFVTDPGQMASALQAIWEIEERSWKASAGTSLLSRDWEKRFYDQLTTRFAPLGQVLITIASLDHTAVAYDLSLLGSGRAYCLKTSFDASRPELSAGVVLRAELMQRVFDAGMREYDFLGKNERYKLEWSGTVRQSEHLRLLNPKSIMGMALVMRQRFQRKARADSTPAMADLVAAPENGVDFDRAVR